MNKTNKLFFQGHLHCIIFFWPICLLLLAGVMYHYMPLYSLWLPFLLIGLLWGSHSALNYLSCSIQVTDNFLVIQTGIFVRQTLNFSLQQLESVDVVQTLIGCLLNYGSLSVRGTGGTNAFFGPMANPLTCRRFLESMPLTTHEH